MKKLEIYLHGFIIGMVAEYCYRVEFGYLQAIILTALVVGMLIDIVESWNK